MSKICQSYQRLTLHSRKDPIEIDIHPDVFNFNVDQHAIHRSLKWQRTFKKVDMSFEQERMETGEKVAWKPWGGSGFGFERVRNSFSNRNFSVKLKTAIFANLNQR